MNFRVAHIWSNLQQSLWFVPGLLALAGIGLSVVSQYVDSAVTWPESTLVILYGGTAEGAQATLTAVASSMIGVTGVVFSITVVALSLASSQLGPRLLRSFMRDTTNQVVLGTFIGTFAFCILGLQAIDREASEVPRLTVTVGIALSLASLGVLIWFIHHISSSMQADTVIARVTKELHDTIDRMYPSEMGLDELETLGETEPWPPEGEPAVLFSSASGYVQAIGEDELMALTTEHDLQVGLDVRPGDHVQPGERLLRVWPRSRVDDDLLERLESTFILGRGRTAEQDVEFLVDQLVEVACRSLSPGINDPFTAMTCLDRMGSALSRLARRRLPSPRRHDDQGSLRIFARRTSFEGLVEAGFNQIRQYGKASVSVTIRLLETLEAIAEHMFAHDPRNRVILAQAQRMHRMSRQQGHDPDDQRDIDERYGRVLQALGEAEPAAATA